MEACLHKWFIKDNHFVSCGDFESSTMLSDDVIYEVVRVMDGRILFLDEHLLRLQKSALLAGFEPVYNAARATDYLQHLVLINNIEEGNVKIVALPTTHPAGFSFGAWFIPHTYPDQKMYDDGVAVSLLDFDRQHPNIKRHRLAYREKVNKAMSEQAVYEVLLTNHGLITEGSRSNVFFISGEECFTAPDEMVLQGITRQKIIRICESLRINLRFEAIPATQIQSFDAAFITGTSPKVLPIARIGDHSHFNVNHPVLIKIKNAYDALIAAYR